MGTWALHSFANDDAGDFIGDLVEGTDLSPVQEAIERVQSTAGYLEAPEAQQGIAACEVVALVLGHASAASQAEEELTAWLTSRLAKYKIPKCFVFLEALPRTPYGKETRTPPRCFVKSQVRSIRSSRPRMGLLTCAERMPSSSTSRWAAPYQRRNGPPRRHTA